MSGTTASALDVVQAQLMAYNARDIDTFAALFAEDATLFELGAPIPAAAGRAAIRSRYAALFESSPNLYSRLLSRVCLGNTVVDLERIVGRNGAREPVMIIAIYQIRDGLIQYVHFARE